MRRSVLVLLATVLLAACGGKPPVQVLYAGSLVSVMEQGIGPAFAKASGEGYEGQGAGSVALANAIRDKTKRGDVFISADPAVNAGLSSWYVVFARTSMVLAWSPKSALAPAFEQAKAGKRPWYDVLEQPGLRLGRTDPALDPKGYRTLLMFQLAERYYGVSGLTQRVVQPGQEFPEETLETRLETGALDAGIFYLNEAVEKGLPYLSLPDQINLSNPSLAAEYAQATWTSPKGQTIHGAPIVYTATVLASASSPPAGATFIAYLLSPAGQAILKGHGLLPSPVLYGGDRSNIPAAIAPLLAGPYSG